MTAFVIIAALVAAAALALLLRPFLMKQAQGGRRTIVGLLVTVPLASAAMYAVLGNAAGIDPQSAAPADHAQRAQVEKMVASLAARLEANPGNLKGWALLGRSYKVMGRTAEAANAYERAGSYLDSDPDELANYADVAATLANGNLAGKPQQLLDKALKIDPNHGMSLWLAGTAAMQSKDYDRAVALWERLAAQLPPDSEDAREIASALNEVKSLGGKSSGKTVIASASTSAASVSGTVDLDDALKAKVQPTDTVMVIARAPGSRMPVAVLRAKASQLPLKFTLDDSMSMSPVAKLSATPQVEIEARISRTGMAKAEAGDLVSAVQNVKLGAKDLRIHVAQVRE